MGHSSPSPSNDGHSMMLIKYWPNPPKSNKLRQDGYSYPSILLLQNNLPVPILLVPSRVQKASPSLHLPARAPKSLPPRTNHIPTIRASLSCAPRPSTCLVQSIPSAAMGKEEAMLPCALVFPFLVTGIRFYFPPSFSCSFGAGSDGGKGQARGIKN